MLASNLFAILAAVSLTVARPTLVDASKRQAVSNLPVCYFTCPSQVSLDIGLPPPTSCPFDDVSSSGICEYKCGGGIRPDCAYNPQTGVLEVGVPQCPSSLIQMCGTPPNNGMTFKRDKVLTEAQRIIKDRQFKYKPKK